MTASLPPDTLPRVDMTANRRARKYSAGTQIARVLWGAAHPLFALSPRPLWGFRRALLRLFGAEVGRAVRIHPTARVMMPWNVALGDFATVGDRAILYALGPIRIGASATVSQYAHLCAGTHDYRAPDLPLVKAPITIGEGAWVCADAFVGPHVVVGDYAVVGARAVAVKDVPPAMVVAGNPARPIKPRWPETGTPG